MCSLTVSANVFAKQERPHIMDPLSVVAKKSFQLLYCTAWGTGMPSRSSDVITDVVS